MHRTPEGIFVTRSSAALRPSGRIEGTEVVAFKASTIQSPHMAQSGDPGMSAVTLLLGVKQTSAARGLAEPLQTRPGTAAGLLFV
jgi:hypothetical protein